MPVRTTHRRTALALLVLLGGAAFVLSLVLSAGTKNELHTTGRLHLWMHLALFLLLGALGTVASARARMRALFLAGTVLLGLAIEVAEALRFQSPFEPYDVLMDTCGVLAGFLAAYLLFREEL